MPHAERLGIFQRGGEIVRLVRLAETTEQGGIKRHAEHHLRARLRRVAP